MEPLMELCPGARQALAISEALSSTSSLWLFLDLLHQTLTQAYEFGQYYIVHVGPMDTNHEIVEEFGSTRQVDHRQPRQGDDDIRRISWVFHVLEECSLRRKMDSELLNPFICGNTGRHGARGDYVAVSVFVTHTTPSHPTYQERYREPQRVGRFCRSSPSISLHLSVRLSPSVRLSSKLLLRRCRRLGRLLPLWPFSWEPWCVGVVWGVAWELMVFAQLRISGCYMEEVEQKGKRSIEVRLLSRKRKLWPRRIFVGGVTNKDSQVKARTVTGRQTLWWRGAFS